MSKIEISINLDGNNNHLIISSTNRPNFDEDSFRHHSICARKTLYPGKSIDEINEILDDFFKELKNKSNKSK